MLARCWRHWRRPLRLVKPSTVIAWHRKGWRLYWRWKSRPGWGGRPGIPIATIDLIRRISHENPLYVKRTVMWNWGASPPPCSEMRRGSTAKAMGYVT